MKSSESPRKIQRQTLRRRVPADFGEPVPRGPWVRIVFGLKARFPTAQAARPGERAPTTSALKGRIRHESAPSGAFRFALSSQASARLQLASTWALGILPFGPDGD
jgi:hypothetical protein